ncbi:MAG: amidase [Methylobacteriaceae bacterium]|jgi:aspartyl-tRNA(Asn)/glutamyl-tRNA(Gln) amidotransferase subunit A|nr:amidase [Methylobacteriaceae bacterium]
MTPDRMLDLTLLEAHRVLRAGDVSAAELTEAALARIAADKDASACFVRLAKAHAVEAARRVKAPVVSPLAGIPVAHKDIFSIRDEVTTFCSHPALNRKGRKTADAVAALDRAGAINLGALHLSEFAMGPAGWNERLGYLANPLDKARVTGGSSSGSAAAVARKLVFASLGTDTGGSIRIPAAFCGIVGLKPSNGLVSTRGVFPDSPALDTVGPLTRSVADCAAVLDVLTGTQTYSTALEEPPDLSACRVGMLTDTSLPVKPDREVAEAMLHVREALERIGCAIVDIDSSLPADAGPMSGIVFLSDAASIHMEHLTGGAERLGPQVRNRLLLGASYPAAAYATALRLRQNFLLRWKTEFLSRADILLMPATPCLPPLTAAYDTLDADAAIAFNGRIGGYTGVWNYLGMPALSLPVRRGDAFPVGLQVIADTGRDADVLRAGLALERLLGTDGE